MIDYKIIKITDEIYPEKLRKIESPPKILYVKGNLDLLYEDMIAIVGTRRITDYGKKCVRKFATELALRNIPIISGMAIGTDYEAHSVALQYESPTIAVLGTGFENIYPKENIELYNNILKYNGLILTEKAPNTMFKSSNFSRRNRIISGLSDGVLAIEAGKNSGTGVTVKYAKLQNKLVFSVPGKITDNYSMGTNDFIKNGAILVTEIEDILQCYPQFMNKKRKTINKNKVKSEYQKIYEILKEKPSNIEEIQNKIANSNIIQLNNLLTMMELDDIIEKDFGNGYKIKEENA